VQKHRYKLSFFITLIVYIALIASYIYINQHKIIVDKPHVKTIELSLQTFIPPPQIPPQPEFDDFFEKPKLKTNEPKQLPLIDEDIATITKPIIKIKPPSKPKPKKRKKIKKHPKKKKHIEKIIQKQQQPESFAPQPSEIPATSTQPKKRQIASTANKEKFLARLRKKIDQGKSYPSIAKKRRVQGIVHVSFTISPTGELQNLQINGPRIFQSSAKNAVKNAFPVDTSSVTKLLPLNIRLKLHYQIH